MLGPGQSVLHINDAQKRLSEHEFAMIRDGATIMVFAGIISYRDIFGKRHLSTFKYHFKGTGDIVRTAFDLSACGKGNIGN